MKLSKQEVRRHLRFFVIGPLIGGTIGWLAATYSPHGIEMREKIARVQAQVDQEKQKLAGMEAATASLEEQIAIRRTILYFRTYSGPSAHGPDAEAVLRGATILHANDPWAHRMWFNYSATNLGSRILSFADLHPPASACSDLVREIVPPRPHAAMTMTIWVTDGNGRVIATAADGHYDVACKRPDAVLAGAIIYRT